MSRTMVELLDRPTITLDPRLLGAVESKMLIPARHAGVELVPAGVTGPPRQELVHTSQHGSWIFTDHVDDPTAASYNGRIPIPQTQRQVLKLLDRCGVCPDLVWVAHEVHDTWRMGDPVHVPAPRKLRESDARLTRRLSAAARTYVIGAAALFTAAAAPGMGVMALGAGMDPIILGGVWDPTGRSVAWCVLAQWSWE